MFIVGGDIDSDLETDFHFENFAQTFPTNGSDLYFTIKTRETNNKGTLIDMLL